MPSQLRLPPIAAVFAVVTVESHSAMSADPGTPFSQLPDLFRFCVLFFLVLTAASREEARPNDRTA